MKTKRKRKNYFSNEFLFTQLIQKKKNIIQENPKSCVTQKNFFELTFFSPLYQVNSAFGLPPIAIHVKIIVLPAEIALFS